MTWLKNEWLSMTMLVIVFLVLSIQTYYLYEIS